MRGARSNYTRIIFQRISMSPTICQYQNHQKSLCQPPCYCCQVPNFYRTFLFSYLEFFALLVRQLQLHPRGELSLFNPLMYLHSFFAVFAFSNWSIYLNNGEQLIHDICIGNSSENHFQSRGNFYFRRKSKTFLRQYLVLFQYFFSEIRDSSSTTALT